MYRLPTFIAFLLLFASSAAVANQTGDHALLTKYVARLTEKFADDAGICALHVQTNWQFCHHGALPFSLASTYKVPIAMQFLRRAQAEGVELDRLVPLSATDMLPYGPLANLFPQAELAVTWRKLLHLMITNSDNTAADLILRQAGGPPAVMAMLKDLQIEGMRIDRSGLQQFFDMYGLGAVPADGRVGLEKMAALRAQTPLAAAAAADAAYGADPRDHTTPLAMAQVLRELVLRAPKEHGMQLLWEIMAQTPATRMMTMLPPGLRAARKTGTNAPHAYNDVGIIDLPDNRGQLILTIYLRGANPEAEKELLVAHLARAIFDYVIFTGA